MKGLITSVEICAHGGPAGALWREPRARTWLQVFGEAEDHPGPNFPGGGAGVTLECCGEVVYGEALRGSWRRGVGDSEGVARVRSLLQVHGLA